MKTNRGTIIRTILLSKTIGVIFVIFSGLALNNLNSYYQDRPDDTKERMADLEPLNYEDMFIIPQVFADKEEDKDNNDKEEEQTSTTGTYCNGIKYYGITDCSNLGEIKKQQQQQEEEFLDEKRKLDRQMANIIDLVENFNTSDLVEMCQYMQDSGHYKKSVDCLEWAMDDTKNHKEIIKNFAILKSFGLYD